MLITWAHDGAEDCLAVVEVKTRKRCFRVGALERLHEGKLKIGLDDTRLEMRANRSNLHHDPLIEAVVLRRHGDVQNRNGHSGIGDHQIEELGKWFWRCFKGGIGKEVRVVRADCLQNVGTTEDDCEMFRSVGLHISDCSLADDLDLLQAIIRLQVPTELLRSAVSTLVTTESCILQCAHHRVVPDHCTDVIGEVLQNLVIYIVEKFWGHIRSSFHQILGREDLELFISNGARVVFLNSELVG